jgi:hypothetical protein
VWVDEVYGRVTAAIEDVAAIPAYLIRGPPLLRENEWRSRDERKAIANLDILDLDAGILRRCERSEAWAR